MPPPRQGLEARDLARREVELRLVDEAQLARGRCPPAGWTRRRAGRGRARSSPGRRSGSRRAPRPWRHASRVRAPQQALGVDGVVRAHAHAGRRRDVQFLAIDDKGPSEDASSSGGRPSPSPPRGAPASSAMTRNSSPAMRAMRVARATWPSLEAVGDLAMERVPRRVTQRSLIALKRSMSKWTIGEGPARRPSARWMAWSRTGRGPRRGSAAPSRHPGWTVNSARLARPRAGPSRRRRRPGGTGFAPDLGRDRPRSRTSIDLARALAHAGHDSRAATPRSRMSRANRSRSAASSQTRSSTAVRPIICSRA